MRYEKFNVTDPITGQDFEYITFYGDEGFAETFAADENNPRYQNCLENINNDLSESKK